MASSVTFDVHQRSNAAKVIAYSAGAQVNGAQSAVNTVTVHSGHGFATNDLFLYSLTEDNILTDRVFTVTGTTTTSVTFSGATFSFPDASVLVNLEADTVVVNDDGSWPLPNYDGSTIVMYSDPAENNIVTSAVVPSDKEIQFWSSSIPIWVLSLTQGNHPVTIYRDVGFTSSASGAGPNVFRQSTVPVGAVYGDIWLRTGGTYDIKYTYMATSTGDDWVEEVRGAVV